MRIIGQYIWDLEDKKVLIDNKQYEIGMCDIAGDSGIAYIGHHIYVDLGDGETEWDSMNKKGVLQLMVNNNDRSKDYGKITSIYGMCLFGDDATPSIHLKANQIKEVA